MLPLSKLTKVLCMVTGYSELMITLFFGIGFIQKVN